MTNLSTGELIRIAVIDDDEDDYLFISDFIKAIDGKRFTTDWFRDYESAIADIRTRSHHLYFVDYFLGNKTGLDLLKEATAMNFDRPIVLLTGFGSKDIDVRAMECGATDYLIKSELNTEKLERCMRYALERTTFLEELKAREIKYRNLFEASKDAVFIADSRLVFTEANHSAFLLLESKSGTLSGRSLYDFIGDEVQKARIRDLVKSSGNIDDLEIKIRRDDKETRNCLLSLRVQNHPGQQPMVHGIIHDITNIKKAELLNLQTEKLAANERLIRMLAHEIRNPLNNIILSVEHLLPANDDDSQKNFLGIIERNSIRINQIITELLNLASPSELVFEKHTLQSVIEESLARASDRILLHNIQVEKEYPKSPLVIAADKNKLVIALTNILINAVEAMEINEGKLMIKLETTADAHVLSIKDNGRGIPREYLSKLFDPFFTLKKNGMGLGLTASYSIIQSHKASMQVESNVDEGTNFIIGFNKQ
ncbi:MAG TPA: ATP-binding protein [Chitinophagaceae bacterium]|jgi:PAS domain S-box-containing protein|nr:ATP-binding protein [Chitinophagaceae bacterium]